MDLIVNEVMQLQHINAANGHPVLESFSGAAVIENSLAVFRQVGRLNRAEDLILAGPVKYRGSNMDTGNIRNRHPVFIKVIACIPESLLNFRIAAFDLDAQLTNGHTEMSLQNLSDIHTARNAQRIKHDVYRRTVR